MPTNFGNLQTFLITYEYNEFICPLALTMNAYLSINLKKSFLTDSVFLFF